MKVEPAKRPTFRRMLVAGKSRSGLESLGLMQLGVSNKLRRTKGNLLRMEKWKEEGGKDAKAGKEERGGVK